ncbi:MAG: hypothetical protein AAFU85_23290, partial [Planctomycetota bacterium]
MANAKFSDYLFQEGPAVLLQWLESLGKEAWVAFESMGDVLRRVGEWVENNTPSPIGKFCLLLGLLIVHYWLSWLSSNFISASGSAD